MDDSSLASFLITCSIGLVMAAFGASQLRSPQKWSGYVPGLVKFILPVSFSSFMRTHGATNVVLGVLLASTLWQPVTIWIALFWWVSILPFAFYYEFAAGMRDFAIIVALIALLV